MKYVSSPNSLWATTTLDEYTICSPIAKSATTLPISHQSRCAGANSVRTNMSGPSVGHEPHELTKALAAGLEIEKCVVASATRGQENGVPGLTNLRRCGDGVIQGLHAGYRRLAYTRLTRRLHDERRRLAEDDEVVYALTYKLCPLAHWKML